MRCVQRPALFDFSRAYTVCEEVIHSMDALAPVVDDVASRQQYFAKRYVDPNASLLLMLHGHVFQRDYRYRQALQPHRDYIRHMLPPSEYPDCPASVMCTKYSHTSVNKQRSPINCLSWARDSKRIMTGAANGEFCAWDGRNFSFEATVKAHDRPIRSLTATHNGQWLLSGDHDGIVKFWSSTLSLEHSMQAHTQEEGMATVRSITFAPGDGKYATCSDDSLIKVWDFETQRCENILRGHGWDVKSVRWHPSKGLLVSGSKDNTVKLWDPKTGKILNTIHSHKHTVLRVDWSPNGNWFFSCGKDQMVKLFDIRTMREFETLKGHDCDVTAAAWHPHHHRVLCTGDIKGQLMYWIVGCHEPQVAVPYAHESAIWDIQFSPLGNIVATASGDTTTKFWCRPLPGDTQEQARTKDQAMLETSEGMNDRAGSIGRTGFAALPESTLSSVLAATRALEDAKNNRGNVIQHIERRAPGPGYICKICKTPGHFITDCPHKDPPPADYLCFLCKTPGHWKNDCPTMQQRY